jgi:hypothetical protein
VTSHGEAVICHGFSNFVRPCLDCEMPGSSLWTDGGSLVSGLDLALMIGNLNVPNYHGCEVQESDLTGCFHVEEEIGFCASKAGRIHHPRTDHGHHICSNSSQISILKQIL